MCARFGRKNMQLKPVYAIIKLLTFFENNIIYITQCIQKFWQICPNFRTGGTSLIQRNFYLNQLISLMWNGNIKVITGIRRCGKSVLLFNLFYEYLINNGVNENNIIKIELDKIKFLKFRNPFFLCNYIENIITSNTDKKFYLFIDEVQLTVSEKDRESGISVSIFDMLNELKGYPNLDCYVTGSNSKMLSSDISTQFRGRSSQIRVFPLSFKEISQYKETDNNTLLDEYMQYGGMPGVIGISDKNEKRKYLDSLYSEIYLRDLVEHGRIKREDVLGEILDYLASQIGSLSNPTKISNTINNKKIGKVDEGLVSRYLNYLSDAFLISQAKRYDIKGQKYFDYPNKYYYCDLGLRNSRLNYRQNDPGHIMENIIYNELLRRGVAVDVGVVEDRRGGEKKQKEIDFVVNHFDKRVYIQSALRMDNEEKIESELDSLKQTGDFFKKIIIRNDIPESFYDKNGILHMKLLDFLLEKIDL